MSDLDIAHSHICFLNHSTNIYRVLIIKRPLHKRKLLQAMTSAALKQTNYYQHPRRGFLKASRAQGSSPRAYAGTPGVGPSPQMHVKLCLSVCQYVWGRQGKAFMVFIRFKKESMAHDRFIMTTPKYCSLE